MHRDLRQLLSHARGESHFVIAVFLDVRGFSSFAKVAESVEAAVFLRSAYTAILDNYFKEVSFFKPTGDGLLVVIDYDETNLTEKVNNVVERSVALVRDFPSVTAHDPMVNFKVPDKLGIGIARGAATSLVSDGKVLDYSGRPLNLAARLMDMARPRGVVFDASVGPDLLNPGILDAFTDEPVYVRGIAETEPTRVFYLKDETEISPINRRPLTFTPLKILPAEEITFKQLKERAPYFRHLLPSRPSDVDSIKVNFNFKPPTAGGRQHARMTRTGTYSAEFVEIAGKPRARVHYQPVVDVLTSMDFKPSWKVKVIIEYPE
jgi:class 3 adenylate cyclase